MTYIDNWYSSGYNRDAYKATHALLSQNDYGKQPTILGVNVDCEEKTLQLNKRYERHIPFLQEAAKRNFTHIELWRILGVTMRYVQVANRPLHDLYFFLCLIRRTSQALAYDESDQLWEAQVHCSPVERRQLQEIVHEACEMKKYRIMELDRNNATVLFTDASAKAWGAVRLENHTMHVSSGPLPQMDIHEGEAIAVMEGLRDCEPLRPVTILVDNTIVAHAIERGHSSNRAVNELCARIACWHAPIQVGWIPSEENWADGPSRTQHIRLPEVSKMTLRPAKQWLRVCVAANTQTTME